MSNQKVYYWSGAVDKKYEVKAIPAGKHQLVNFAIEKGKTYRDDMDGICYTIHSDTPFCIYITDGKNTVAHLHAEEVLKYWHSTLNEAVAKAKEYATEESSIYYVYKVSDNLYDISTLKLIHKR